MVCFDILVGFSDSLLKIAYGYKYICIAQGLGNGEWGLGHKKTDAHQEEQRSHINSCSWGEAIT